MALVHATMDADVVQTAETVTDEPIKKDLLLATKKQLREYNEIFAIEDDVRWCVVSRNLHQYRLKPVTKLTLGHSSSGPQKLVRRIDSVLNDKINSTLIFFFRHSNKQPAKVHPMNRMRTSYFERPPTIKRVNRKLPGSDSDGTVSDESDTTSMYSKPRKRKSSVDGYETDWSDENQENVQKRPSLDSDRNQSGAAENRTGILIRKNYPQKPLVESNQSGSGSDFDSLFNGPLYHKGSEIASKENIPAVQDHHKNYSYKY